jgi:hypothetical protein
VSVEMITQPAAVCTGYEVWQKCKQQINLIYNSSQALSKHNVRK